MDIEKLLEATKGAGKDNPEKKEAYRYRKRMEKRIRVARFGRSPSEEKRLAEKRKATALKRAERERVKKEEERRKKRRLYALRNYDPVKAKAYRELHPRKKNPLTKDCTFELPKDVAEEFEAFCSKHKLRKKVVVAEALKKYMSEYDK